MLQVFVGEDTFASYNAARAYATKLSAQTGAELVILDGDELISGADLMRPLDNVSLFAEAKVVFAKRLFGNSKIAKFLEDNLPELQAKPLVVWHDKKLDARTSLSKSLKSLGVISEFAVPAVPELVSWLTQEAKQLGVNLPHNLAQRLVEYKGSDRGILHQELQKLVGYHQATGKTLDLQALDALTGTEAAGDIWKFLDALAMGNRAAAMVEFEKLTRFTDNTQYLLSMLSRELTIIAQVIWAKQNGRSTQSLKLHPFVLEKASKKASRLNWAKVQKLSQALLRLDVAIKQGRVDEQVGLTAYLLSW